MTRSDSVVHVIREEGAWDGHWACTIQMVSMDLYGSPLAVTSSDTSASTSALSVIGNGLPGDLASGTALDLRCALRPGCLAAFLFCSAEAPPSGVPASEGQAYPLPKVRRTRFRKQELWIAMRGPCLL